MRSETVKSRMPLITTYRRSTGSVLMESRTAGRAGPADRVLRELQVRPIRVSKDCVAAALLNPDLRSNLWHRTVRPFTRPG